MNDAWHSQCEWENAVAYEHGFRAGVQHAREAFDRALAEAIDPGPEVNPGARNAILDRTAQGVIADYLHTIIWTTQ